MEGDFALHHSSKTLPWTSKPGLRDVEREYESEPCEVLEGEIPQWMSGSLYHQTGGAFLGDKDIEFLDGLAHISSFHLKNGKALFSNKYMRTKEFSTFISTGKREWGVTAQSTAQGSTLMQSLFDGLSKIIYPSKKKPAVLYKATNPNVTTWLIGDSKQPRLAAITEADGVVCEFNPETLSTINAVSTMPTNGFVVTNAAHWFLDHDSQGGYHVALDLSWKMAGLQPKFTFKYVIYHGMEPPYRPVAELPIATFKWGERAKQPSEKRASYMHTIAQTSNYVILIGSCMRMKYEDLLARHMPDGFFGLFSRVKDPVEFSVFKIVDKATQKLDFIGKFCCPPGESYMVWHLANCFESDGKIFIDGAVSENVDEATDDGALSMAERHSIKRFEIDLRNGFATCTTLLPYTKVAEYDFPNINPKFHHRDYQFIYALNNPLAVATVSSVTKLDLSSNTAHNLVGLRPSEVPSEPIFVPRPDSTDELDGVILTEAIDTITGTSDLLICDPETFSVQARIRPPMCANFGLHSTWIDHMQFDLTSKY